MRILEPLEKQKALLLAMLLIAGGPAIYGQFQESFLDINSIGYRSFFLEENLSFSTPNPTLAPSGDEGMSVWVVASDKVIDGVDFRLFNGNSVLENGYSSVSRRMFHNAGNPGGTIEVNPSKSELRIDQMSIVPDIVYVFSFKHRMTLGSFRAEAEAARHRISRGSKSSFPILMGEGKELVPPLHVLTNRGLTVSVFLGFVFGVVLTSSLFMFWSKTFQGKRVSPSAGANES